MSSWGIWSHTKAWWILGGVRGMKSQGHACSQKAQFGYSVQISPGVARLDWSLGPLTPRSCLHTTDASAQMFTKWPGFPLRMAYIKSMEEERWELECEQRKLVEVRKAFSLQSPAPDSDAVCEVRGIQEVPSHHLSTPFLPFFCKLLSHCLVHFT